MLCWSGVVHFFGLNFGMFYGGQFCCLEGKALVDSTGMESPTASETTCVDDVGGNAQSDWHIRWLYVMFLLERIYFLLPGRYSF